MFFLGCFVVLFVVFCFCLGCFFFGLFGFLQMGDTLGRALVVFLCFFLFVLNTNEKKCALNCFVCSCFVLNTNE